MARTQRASAAAAAKKIAVQAEEHDDVMANSGDAKRTTRRTSTTTTLPNRSAKRKRESESPEYDDGAGQEEADDDEDDVEDDDGEEEDEDDAKQSRSRPPPQKKLMVETPVATKVKKARRPTNSAAAFALEQRLFLRSTATNDTPPACCPPERLHSVDYHRPLLLDGATGRKARRALLAWYDSVSATRGMPWRRPWMDPAVGLEGKDETARTELARRAYQVWISEVMAQQTRIAVVIGYWTRWMARWPTLEDLAAALDSEVFQEWSGLGYYSRASRVHEAAILVASDPTFRGLLPPDVATLESRIPGVGRYTAGAVSAIVYGRAAPMVDGNVIRVLSRQLGVFADSKAEKALVDLLWAAAEALVKAVARDGPKEGDEVADDVEDADVPVSDRPGRWGQALMELGSTVCAPKPDCAACPISSTCRTYAEGLALHERNTKGTVPLALVKREDGETDPCDLCEQFPELDEEEAAALAKADKKEEKKGKDAKKDKKVAKSPFFDVEDAAAGVSKEALSTIVTHARTFPLRRPKKPVREVETLVCAIRYAGKGQNLYLLHQRPAKGLLASLWQLPSYDLPAPLDSKAARRKEAEAFVTRWLADVGSSADGAKKGTNAKVVKCTAATTPLRTTKTKELGSVPWLFSHLRQTMHIYVFDVVSEGGGIVKPSNLSTPASCCWASETEAEKTYSMGTGMRKCWTLVKDT